MLELPNAQCREQKRFGARECAGCGHGRPNIVARLILGALAISAAAAGALFVHLGFFDATSGRSAYRHMTAAVHNALIPKQLPDQQLQAADGFRPTCQPLINLRSREKLRT